MKEKSNEIHRKIKRKTRKEREDILKERMGEKFLNSKEIEKLKMEFLGKNKELKFDKKVLENKLKEFECNLNEGKIKDIFNEVDKKGKIKIDFELFLDYLSSEIDFSEETLRRIYNMYINENKEDTLNLENLKKLNSIYNEKELQEIIEGTNSNNSGKINFEDFCNIITTKL